ncbi:MAG: hypothetical protein F6K55_16185 [Moorea sp. SIO4A3]|nr:hypothetical protein [Moorena sp. SIO4A3]
MRYTLFFPSSLFPLPSSLFPAPKSLLRSPCSEVPKNQRFVPHGYKTCYILMDINQNQSQTSVFNMINYSSA